jgi:hypothetical protein
VKKEAAVELFLSMAFASTMKWRHSEPVLPFSGETDLQDKELQTQRDRERDRERHTHTQM